MHWQHLSLGTFFPSLEHWVLGVQPVSVPHSLSSWSNSAEAENLYWSTTICTSSFPSQHDGVAARVPTVVPDQWYVWWAEPEFNLVLMDIPLTFAGGTKPNKETGNEQNVGGEDIRLFSSMSVHVMVKISP